VGSIIFFAICLGPLLLYMFVKEPEARYDWIVGFLVCVLGFAFFLRLATLLR
jgi:hypothetical protein